MADVGHGVWLYFRFPLGLRMVEKLLAARGIIGPRPRVDVRIRRWLRAHPVRIAVDAALGAARMPAASVRGWRARNAVFGNISPTKATIRPKWPRCRRRASSDFRK
jgi:hypothetical protein